MPLTLTSSDWWPLYHETECSAWGQWTEWAMEELLLLTSKHPNKRCLSIVESKPCGTCGDLTGGRDLYYGWRIAMLANTGIKREDDPIPINDRRNRNLDFRPVFSTPGPDEPKTGVM